MVQNTKHEYFKTFSFTKVGYRITMDDLALICAKIPIAALLLNFVSALVFQYDEVNQTVRRRMTKSRTNALVFNPTDLRLQKLHPERFRYNGDIPAGVFVEICRCFAFDTEVDVVFCVPVGWVMEGGIFLFSFPQQHLPRPLPRHVQTRYPAH